MSPWSLREGSKQYLPTLFFFLGGGPDDYGISGTKALVYLSCGQTAKAEIPRDCKRVLRVSEGLVLRAKGFFRVSGP